jgi:hypothetical protein
MTHTITSPLSCSPPGSGIGALLTSDGTLDPAVLTLVPARIAEALDCGDTGVLAGLGYALTGLADLLLADNRRLTAGIDDLVTARDRATATAERLAASLAGVTTMERWSR